jgi:hypothetical protein
MAFYANNYFKMLGPNLVAGQDLNNALGLDQCHADTAAAATGTTLATAYQIVASHTVFTTVVAGGRAKAQQAVPGTRMSLFNTGGNTLTISGFAATDTFDGNASFTLSAANRATWVFCDNPGQWRTALMGTTSS